MQANHDFYIEEHAVLYALLVRAARTYGAEGEAAAVEATCRYGRERGARMAKRALRDGRELTMLTYTQYGEWADTKGWSKNKVSALAPVYITDATRCGWCDSWQKHDLLEDGKLYCAHIDHQLVKGFNPDNELTITTLLSHGEASCHFIWNGVSFENEEAAAHNAQLKADMIDRNTRGFLYHTAHLYASMRATFDELMGAEKAEAITTRALADFEMKFGAVKKQLLLEAAGQDFTAI